MIYLYIFLTILAVSLLSLLGVFALWLKKAVLAKILLFLVAFSAGALIGDSFLHLLPEIVAKKGLGITVSFPVFAGMLSFFILEKVLRWHHCHNEKCEEHSHEHLGIINLVGDGFHNVIDGLLIGASFFVSIPVGIATTIAVALHEIPQELGDFGVLVHSGFTRKKALFFNILSGLMALLGGGLAIFLADRVDGFVQFMMPYTVGGFLYIALADLVPELHRDTHLKRTILHIFGFVAGIAIMWLLLFFG